MNKFTAFAGLICLATLASCASGPNFKTYGSTLSAPKPGESRVWFYRPTKVAGSAVQPTIYMNDVIVGKAQPGCYFYVDRPPGNYVLKCTTEWSDHVPMTVEKDKTCYVRIRIVPGLFVGHIRPTPVPEETALREIRGCRLITAGGRNKDWKRGGAEQ